MRGDLNLRIHWYFLGSILFLWGMFSCAGGQGVEHERADWLRTTLFEDHLDLWLRDPNLVAHKFELMASDPYRYLRGTLPQYLRDVMEDGANVTSVASLESSQVLLMGDPHLENFGTFLSSSGDVVIELNDFDSAQYGPFHFDLRRFVSSVFIAQRYWSSATQTLDLEGGSDPEAERFAKLAAAAYVEEIIKLESSASMAIESPLETTNPWTDQVRSRSLQRGLDNHSLQKWTQVDSGVRTFRKLDKTVDEALQATDDILMSISDDDEKKIRTALFTYPNSMWVPQDGVSAQIKDMARRYGAGISSIPLRRIYLLMEGATSDAEDDFILELKEARDPFVLTQLPLTPRRAFRQNAERIVESQRRMQCEPELDPWLGYTQGEGAFRVRELSGFQDGVDLGKLRDAYQAAEIRDSDLEGFVEDLARILARSHARGNTISGEAALPAIADAVRRNPAGVVEESARFGVRYGQNIIADYELFRDLINQYGTDLGFPNLYR